MLTLYDRNLRKKAVLHLAHGREEVQVLGGVGSFTFSLPADDPKAALCVPFSFVRDGDGDVYRVLGEAGARGETDVRTFTCEHAIATLVDDLMFGTHILGGAGMPTRAVLEAILARQATVRWRLGDCDFSLQYEYGYESENLLNALFAVPNLFVEPYVWTYDMRTFPWTVSLRRLSPAAKPQYYIRAGRNLIAARATRTGADVCTRLYLRGYGEGDNQLTIAEVNGGVPYLQSPKEYVERYGLICKEYVDRSFEDAPSLLARGRALLAAMQEPRYARAFDVADLYPLTGREIDRARVGDVCRMAEDGESAFVTRVVRQYDEGPGAMRIELATKAQDIAAGLADLADRQRIEQVYAQGATQLYGHSLQENATPEQPAELHFTIPREMRIVNKVLAKIRLQPFRTYSRVTGGGGQSTQTSSSGGGAVATSTAGGGSTQTTTSAGETTLSAAQTVTLDSGGGFITDASSLTVTEAAHPGFSRSTASASAVSTGSASAGVTGRATGSTGSASASSTGSAGGSGAHSHTMLHTHGLNSHSHTTAAHTHTMLHTHGLNSHDHSVGEHRHYMSHTHTFYHKHVIPGHVHTLAAHGHRVTIPSHRHEVTVPAHTHSVKVPSHAHELVHGIYRHGRPGSAVILVGGVEKLDMGEDREVDLTPYLVCANGKIPRGTWIRVGVRPDDAAYVTVDLVVQGFVQSRGGNSH